MADRYVAQFHLGILDGGLLTSPSCDLVPPSSPLSIPVGSWAMAAPFHDWHI